ncbi:hypothetical protein RISK_006162 [Rhodopirellula islandica]|uniref:Uncharacterized protein n=1 Tax=Rhodopirellula islandica TaxID=595434 RepID=A0A0J1B5W0_RHOIS|nr:hypothetical protein RISK_006162 [Rhodopirellula islandica]
MKEVGCNYRARTRLRSSKEPLPLSDTALGRTHYSERFLE